MNKAKYIIVEVRACELPILFHPIISHADVAEGLTVISAGFCEVWGVEPTDISLDTLRVWAGGRSTTLKDENKKYIVSRGDEDADIIKKMLEVT